MNETTTTEKGNKMKMNELKRQYRTIVEQHFAPCKVTRVNLIHKAGANVEFQVAEVGLGWNRRKVIWRHRCYVTSGLKITRSEFVG